ncbi:MAG: fibronectin type III domain-containing protein [Blastocatellia bacterium]
MKTSADTYSKRSQESGVGSRQPKNLLATVYCLLTTVYFLAGCGKIGDPIPPTPRAPLIVQELQVVQQGTELILSFPLMRTANSPKPLRIDVYRLVESASDPLGLTLETFSARSGLIASIEQIPDKPARTAYTITFRDALDLKSSARNQRYRYSVRLVNQSGQAADFSNYAVIAPLFDLALPPGQVKATQQEKQIGLNWSAPATNESGTAPANIAGYNLYRRSGDAVVKLNAQPLTQPRFTDRNFAFGTNYQYTVRALSLLPGNASLAAAIESNESSALAHIPKDTFPPAAPNPVTIASIGGLVSLFWPLNQETDVAGYNIYRAESEQAAPNQWTKLNAQLHKTASFRDDRVQVGKAYFYQITAVDIYGNESARSSSVNETVNP